MANPASGVARRDSQSYVDESLSTANPKSSPSIFPSVDPASHMLALPKSYPRLKRWVAIAFVIGAFAAILLLGLFSM
jgi:hypothetical protein